MFQISLQTDWRSRQTKQRPFLTGQSWRVLKSGYTAGSPEQGLRRCFADGVNQSLISSARRLLNGGLAVIESDRLDCLISSAIYGVATTPNDFATYLLAILIVNGLLYLAFYVIMKVLLSGFAFLFSNLTFPTSEAPGRMGTSLKCSDFWDRLGRQTFVMISIQGNH